MVEARVDFDGSNESVVASLNVPEQPPGFRILTEQAASPGYGFSIIDKAGSRRAEWTKREVVGPQTLYFKAQFIPDPNAEPIPPAQPPKTKRLFWEEPQATAVREILAQAEARSSTPEDRKSVV